MRRIVLASNNPGKATEVQALLRGMNIELIPQSFYFVPAVAETGLSFIENALIKARHACAHTGLGAIADDSGLEVEALAGEPGIYSARYAGEGADDSANNQRLLDELIDAPTAERTARYICIIAYLRHARDPDPLLCRGTWEGRISEQARGENGFGYDPLFYLPALECTAAELDTQAKNRISHRGLALRALLEAFDRDQRWKR
ncbi:MAG: RdgB/HAM1 family non-canonical purine NTP pyrophosphatase [Nitrococcus sp.]|nr:RdgB/HAM1 family non-canonical purine NTP pyrophosphatase [Nitrococcus sp.]